MASGETSNVALLREALLGREGADAFYEVLDRDVEWDTSRAPGRTTIRGRDAVRAYMPSWRHGWEYWRFEEEFIDLGERVVTITDIGDGVIADDRPTAAWTFDGGKVVRFEWYERASEAVAERPGG